MVARVAQATASSLRARAHALAVARLGYALAWQRFPTEARSLIDPWTSIVLHHAIQRDDAA